ncbi:hypothetical protein [Luteococcus peritonei]|uniref:Heme A synthase n=1 Tax=Luteococcus peritonei TaxID=88874 RepID=A0ABW4RZV2_9ACTN
MSTLLLPATTAGAETSHQATRTVYRLAAAAATLTVAMGAINSATGSGFACPTWPGCYPGRFGPETEVHALIEFSHRVVAALTTPLLLVAALMGRRLPRQMRLARRLPWLAILGALSAAVLGMITVFNLGLPKPVAMFDLFSAMTCMSAMTVATLSLEHGNDEWRWSPLARLGGWATGGIVLVHLLGVAVAGKGSFTSVMGWPLWRLTEHDGALALQWLRMAVAVATIALLGLTVARAWRWGRTRRAAAALVLFGLVEFTISQVIAELGTEMWFAATYAGAAAVVLFCAVLVTGRAALHRGERPEGI